MTTTFILDGIHLKLDLPFESRGYKYPATWLRLTTLDEKKAIGIKEVPNE